MLNHDIRVAIIISKYAMPGFLIPLQNLKLALIEHIGKKGRGHSWGALLSAILRQELVGSGREKALGPLGMLNNDLD